MEWSNLAQFSWEPMYVQRWSSLFSLDSLILCECSADAAYLIFLKHLNYHWCIYYYASFNTTFIIAIMAMVVVVVVDVSLSSCFDVNLQEPSSVLLIVWRTIECFHSNQLPHNPSFSPFILCGILADGLRFTFVISSYIL